MNDIDPAMLEAYLVRTRWFGGKGRPFGVAGIASLARLDDPGRTVTVHLVTVEYTDEEGGVEQYQVPLSAYEETEDRIGHALVGSVEGDDGRVRYLYDAVHDRDAMALWLDGFRAAGDAGTVETGGLRFHRVAVAGDEEDPLVGELRSSPLTGEQSNSSVKFDDTAIMKVFRKVTPGVNPDIEIHESLTRGGSEHVADLYGWVETGDGENVLQLGMLQRFLRTAADGFELATGSVRTLMAEPQLSVEESGGDFAGEAERLGEALASVHHMLRERFPAQLRGHDTAAELAAAMDGRLDQARRVVPEIEAYADRLRSAYAAVGSLTGIELQRIHGDLHLGQTLRTSHGWKIVDFEGEPGRPFAERALPDSPWRDVAGMLRSFDYAPRVVEMATAGGEDDEAELRAQRAREWSARARRHFLEAYIAAAGDGARPEAERAVLLDAYVADKAVYEAMYEKRNRPSWITIPLAALARIGGA
ncbi:maltokinase N-terminal cap-like domain-containing protein [Microbacterium marinilacus]|uniref:Maltokinase n=1 Tax=Microbacterium marinilacus TaxID=415209 RepID=A0ABP7BQF6_9MICO|nr:phosphotransferase [Microbacterium marinilacus]MBY0689275.1 phosphotransferase [Microbacterium marinilacus]